MPAVIVVYLSFVCTYLGVLVHLSLLYKYTCHHCTPVMLQVQAVPTVLALKDGKVIDKFIGMKEEADVKSFITKNLPPS